MDLLLLSVGLGLGAFGVGYTVGALKRHRSNRSKPTR